MGQGFSEWGTKTIDEYVDRAVDLVLDAHDPASSIPVEEAIIARDGPIETVVWVALDGYRHHEVFHWDDQPTMDELRKLYSWHPRTDQMPQLKAYFHQHYASWQEMNAACIEIPDTYQPQRRHKPRLYLAAYYDPDEDIIAIGAKATPLRHQERIRKDVNKLLPAEDLDTFIAQVERRLSEEIKAEYDWRLLTGNVRDQLESDPDFSRETIKPIPDGTHPDFECRDAELWQKPAAAVDYIPGSQGFLQVWLPVDDADTAVVTATPGEYDERAVIEETRQRLDTASSAVQ